jgi:hypothetical protein
MERFLACRSVQSEAQPEGSRAHLGAADSNWVSVPRVSTAQPRQQGARKRQQVSMKRQQGRPVQLAAERWARPESVSQSTVLASTPQGLESAPPEEPADVRA